VPDGNLNAKHTHKHETGWTAQRAVHYELGIIMRLITTCLFLVLTSISTAVLSGCISDHQITDAFYNQALADPMDLWVCSCAFRAQYHYWPKDYAELSSFVQYSNGEFKLGHYERVDFTELPNGSLMICSVSNGCTNQATFTMDNAQKKR
jgi:hypothetical protein